MGTTMSNVTPLRPARPEPEGGDESSGYMPKLPWKWILGLGSFLVLSIGTMYVQDERDTERLRASVLKTHRQALGPIVARYEDTVGKVNGWALKAGQAQQVEQYVDPRLNLDALSKGQGLYLRLKAEDAGSLEGIVQGARAMGPDAITRCLGVTPVSARGLYENGAFLAAEWIEQAETAESLMKLRVVEEELRQRTERDLPGVATALKSEWFLLVVEQGADRQQAPVDAYLYDLKSNKLLLRDRVQAEGQLIAARIAVAGVKPGAYSKGDQTGAAQDCSIASQLRELAGRPAAAVAAAAPNPREAYDEALKQNAPQDAPAEEAGDQPAAADQADDSAKPADANQP